jgi:vacuolar-type H+-ATPase subunit H
MNQASHVLEQIRHTELEAARNVDRARDQAEEIVDEARARARRLVEEARERGREDAHHHLETVVAEAEKTAAGIRDHGVLEAGELSESTGGSMDPVIEEMVRVVLAPPAEAGR